MPMQNKNIPDIITKVWGRLSEEKYNKLKSNPSWLELSTRVCDECFITFTSMYFIFIYKFSIITKFNYILIISNIFLA